jgi:hypothetical protein
VTYAWNPNYSGGRDQEDHSLKPAPGKQFTRPYLEKYQSQKRAGGVAQGVVLNSNPSTAKKKKKYLNI